MVTLVSPVQPKKALLPKAVTEFGIVTPVKLVQPEKAESPMSVTELGMVTPVKLVQPEKAEPLIVVTDSGMLTSVILDPCTKATGSSVTSSPMITVSMLAVGIFPRVEQLRAFQTSVLSDVQPLNAE